MSDQVAHNLNTSTSTSSVSCIEDINTISYLFDNNNNNNNNNNSILNFKDIDDDGIEGSLGVGYYSPLHDIFQHLSEVPLHANPIQTPPPPPPPPPSTLTPSGSGYPHLEEGHHQPMPIREIFKQGHQIVGPKLREDNVDVVKGRHSKGKEPLEDEDQHGSSRERMSREANIDGVKGQHSKGKEPLDPDDQHGSSRERKKSQRRNSEHKRRQRINAKMRAIRALVPTCDKGDHVSILDHTIRYIKSSQLQINMMMSRSIGQAQLQYPYAPQIMMQPMMLPGLGYGPWQTQFSPSGYPFMVTPPGYDGVPKQPILQAQAQVQTQAPFAPVLCPLQHIPEIISASSTPTILSFTPPQPQLTTMNPSDESSYFETTKSS